MSATRSRNDERPRRRRIDVTGRRTGIAAILAFAVLAAMSSVSTALELDAPEVILDGVPFDVTASDANLSDGTTVTIEADGQRFESTLQGGEATIEDIVLERTGDVELTASAGDTEATAEMLGIAGWLSIMPALIAIVLALAFRQVIPALFLGIWLGATLTYGFSAGALWDGLLASFTRYTLEALNDSGHLSIILFSLMIGGMVGIVSKNGGTAGIVEAIVGWAKTPRRGQGTTAALGCAIFFDDYANTLIVGNTMRPITDRLRVSREKLAYLVDSTAAPVATIALVTTWIGFQIGLIGDAVSSIDGLNVSAYGVFLNALAYNFYPILAIAFVFLVALVGRDFGPMLKAERRARLEGEVMRPGSSAGASDNESDMQKPKPDQPNRAYNAIIPILVLVFGSLAGIYVTGRDGAGDGAGLREIIGNGDSYAAMMWASLLACLVAGGLALGQRILTLEETVNAWYAGVKAMLLAVIILVLAWSLAGVNEVLNTADWLVSVLGENLPAAWLPALVFVLAGATAFATGSSWGVMGVLMPLAIPLGWALVSANGAPDAAGMAIFHSTVAAVLAGAVWGDHCSPISDTTILSSLACECDHIDHVRTQLPYALTVGLVAIGIGSVPVAFGVYPWWAGLLIGAAVLVAILFVVGRSVPDAASPPTGDHAKESAHERDTVERDRTSREPAPAEA